MTSYLAMASCLLALMVIALPVSSEVYRFVGASGETFYSAQEVRQRSIREFVGNRPNIRRLPLVYRLKTGGVQFSGRDDASLSATAIGDYVDRAASNQGLDPKLIHAVIQAESGYNPFAVSGKGALGLMQLMPSTAHEMGVTDPMDVSQNIEGGTRFLRKLLDQFDSDLELALAAYNAGEGNVRRYGHKVPPFAETKDYVSRVLGQYSAK